jgi:hypothetical protein
MWDSDMLPLFLLRVHERTNGLIVLDLRTPKDMSKPNEKFSRVVCPISLRAALTAYCGEVFPDMRNPVEALCALLVIGGNDFCASVPGCKLKTTLDTATYCEDDLAEIASIEEGAEPFQNRRRVRINEHMAAQFYGRLYTRRCCGKARSVRGVADEKEMAASVARKVTREQRKKQPDIDAVALKEAIRKTSETDVGSRQRVRADARRLQWWFDYAMMGGAGLFIHPQDSVAMSADGKSLYGWVQNAETTQVTRAHEVE